MILYRPLDPEFFQLKNKGLSFGRKRAEPGRSSYSSIGNDLLHGDLLYWLDRQKVLRRKKMTMTLQRPHVEPKVDGKLALGDEEKIYMTTNVEILAYNYNRSITE